MKPQCVTIQIKAIEQHFQACAWQARVWSFKGKLLIIMLSNDHSRSQRPRSFWPATRIETSGPSQHRKSAINGLVVQIWQIWLAESYRTITLRMLKIGSGQRSSILGANRKDRGLSERECAITIRTKGTEFRRGFQTPESTSNHDYLASVIWNLDHGFLWFGFGTELVATDSFELHRLLEATRAFVVPGHRVFTSEGEHLLGVVTKQL